MSERLLFFEDFNDASRGERGLPAGWWVEGGERVWIDDGRLRVKANAPGAIAKDRSNVQDYVCTVWNRTVFKGDIRVEFDAHVIAAEKGDNNINFFFLYGDPNGGDLFESRSERANADYTLYHALDGYIVTFLNDSRGESPPYSDGTTKARFRMRRCPGFRLIDETFDYHCRRGVTYHVALTRKEGRLSYAVDGKVYVEALDPEPLSGGLIGFRTYRTELWWDNVKVTALD